MVEERKASPEGQDDLLSLFLTAEIDGQRLTVDEIVGICFLFILAGLDTVTDSLECFMAYLAQHPEQRQRIVDDPAIIPSTVEELLRWETPVTDGGPHGHRRRRPRGLPAQEGRGGRCHHRGRQHR